MDHAEAREALELAAVEPGGIERLTAGDTSEAAAVAAHLAGCPVCAAELVRLRLAAGAIRQVVRATPPPELRERTLANIAAVGRDRSGARRPELAVAPVAVEPRPARRGFLARPTARLAALAAALIVAVAGTALIVGAQRTAELTAATQTIAALEQIATWSLRVAGQPDAQVVALAPAEGSGPSGRLLFSPGTRELVVIASGLGQPATGKEFRCWVEVDGERRRVGRMFFADDLAFWRGPVEVVADLPPETRFGVSLVDAAGESLDGPTVLNGTL